MNTQGQSSFRGRGQAYGGRAQRGGMMGGRQSYGQGPMGGMGGGQMNGRMGWQRGGNMPGPFMPGMGLPAVGMGMAGMGMGGPMGPPMPFMPPGMGMQGALISAILLQTLSQAMTQERLLSCQMYLYMLAIACERVYLGDKSPALIDQNRLPASAQGCLTGPMV